MGSVTEIWNTRHLPRDLRRHWVRCHQEMLICSEQQEQRGVLSIGQQFAGGPLFATLKVAVCQVTEEISREGKLFININNLRLLVVIRAIDDSRVLLEFSVPRGDQTQIAVGA